jgi:hypothetical protein
LETLFRVFAVLVDMIVADRANWRAAAACLSEIILMVFLAAGRRS